VVEVTFNRPERRNAFTRAMYAELRELCTELAGDPGVRALVLRGAGGKAFAAGNEIGDFVDADAVAYEGWIRELLEALFALPQVTIAAVDGVCVGGGLAVASLTREMLLASRLVTADRAQIAEAAPRDDEATLREVYTGPDFVEGVRAFLAKEKPAFR
jgi:enoyl-CoA hydratase/carnithine racemase